MTVDAHQLRTLQDVRSVIGEAHSLDHGQGERRARCDVDRLIARAPFLVSAPPTAKGTPTSLPRGTSPGSCWSRTGARS